MYSEYFICESCGELINDPVTIHHRERNGEELDPPTLHCSCCSSEELEPAEECALCGEYFADYDMDGNVCNHCLEKLGEKVKRTLRRGDLFFPEEIEIIKDRLEISGLCEWDD